MEREDDEKRSPECRTREGVACPCRCLAIIQTPGRRWKRIVGGGQPGGGAWISGLPPKEREKRLFTGEKEGVGWVVKEEEGEEGGGRGGREASVSSGGEQRVTRGGILYRGRDPLLVARCYTLSAALPFASPRRGCQ